MPELDEQNLPPPTLSNSKSISDDTLIDILFLTGLVFIFAGLGLAVGWGWGLAADGAVLTGTALWLGGKK
jgi:hypothetical protein